MTHSCEMNTHTHTHTHTHTREINDEFKSCFSNFVAFNKKREREGVREREIVGTIKHKQLYKKLLHFACVKIWRIQKDFARIED